MKNLVIVVGVLVLVGVVISTISFSHDDPVISTERYAVWYERINTVGAAAAYEELSQKVATWGEGRTHVEAHEFGGALYEAEGIDGIVICDSKYSFGCYHEFIGRAISDHGIGAIKKLNAICIEIFEGGDPGFCQHGIGHGLIAYFGYTADAFDEALVACDALPDNNAIGGCSGGIYMEYNMHTMLSEDIEIRPVENYFDPCDRLSEKHLSSCYFWTPQWWHVHLRHIKNMTQTDSLQKMGALCEEMVRDESLRSYCYRGIGNVLDGRNQEYSVDMCAHVSQDTTWQTACQQAAQSLRI